MPFKKGQKRPKNAGRKKGTPNATTQHLLGIVQNQGFDPVTEKIKLYKLAIKGHDENDKDRTAYLGIADDALSDLLQYMYPKRKAVDIGEDTQECLTDLIKRISK